MYRLYCIERYMCIDYIVLRDTCVYNPGGGDTPILRHGREVFLISDLIGSLFYTSAQSD